jgi:hypothetical protein
MGRGQLIGESVKVGASLRGVPMRLLGVTRVQPPVDHLATGQPRTWTFIGFELDDADAQSLADELSNVLDLEGGWYCSFATADERWVVFARRAFTYRFGDIDGRAAAVAYAREVGVPEPQLDWDRS